MVERRHPTLRPSTHGIEIIQHAVAVGGGICAAGCDWEKEIGHVCCGPTVHDFAHIGNFRTFVFRLRPAVRPRYLEFKGFTVRHVMNITRTWRTRSSSAYRQRAFPCGEYAAGKYEAAFFDDLRTLGCRMPQETPRATEFIPEIIALVQEKLMARGLAYRQASDKSVYFSIEKYCRAAGRDLRAARAQLNFEEMRAGERVRNDECAKEAVADFALWKSRVPEDGADVCWPEPVGRVKPGWHIECSAMSMKKPA